MSVNLNYEDKLALDNVNLREWLSDSTREVSLQRISTLISEPKCKPPLPVPIHRDAMGCYIPKPGEKQLSQYFTPTPGPKYFPNYDLTLKQSPKYSVNEYHIMNDIKPTGVGPAKYDTRGKMGCEKYRMLSIKGSFPPEMEKVGPGPATNKQRPFDTPGPKYSMPVPHKKAPNHSFVHNPHVMVLNPNTPGPDFQSPWKSWVDKPNTFGTKHEHWEEFTPGPGPGKYGKDKATKQSGYSIGKSKRETNHGTPSPGPGSYTLKSTMGEGSKLSFGLKYREESVRADIPGPDLYHRAGFRLDEPGVTLKYRWMDSDPVKHPGPADYHVDKIPTTKAPAFTIMRRTNPAIPKIPGPADYTPTNINWDKAGKSMGKKWRDLKPNAGATASTFPKQEDGSKLLPVAPAYTLTKSVNLMKWAQQPGPSDYDTTPPRSKKMITIGKKLHRKVKEGPGPAMYSIHEGEIYQICKTTKGLAATLKGRHTPFKYTGLRDSDLIPPPSRSISCLPIIQ